MTEGSEAAKSSKKHDNSQVMSALITGVFGLLGTIVTIFAVRPNPSQPAATSAVVSSPAPAAPQPIPASSPAAAPATPPNYLLNFAAFQARLATPEVGMHEREQIIRPLRGRQVVWKGYVDAITPATSPTPDLAITVALVESSDKLTQSAFKTPAHFRFGPEMIDAVTQLAPGDEVTLTGILTDHHLIGTNITDSGIITINGRPANQVIAAPEPATLR